MNERFSEKVPRTAPIMSLTDKARLCKKAGISYGQFQILTAGCKTKKEINDAVREYMRREFLVSAADNADGTHNIVRK